MSKVRPEALHKMTFTRDASHQIHVIPQHPDTSISICQPLGTQHILHIIYICAQKPSQAPCQAVRMRHDGQQSSEHDDRQIDNKNLLARPCRLVSPEDHKLRLHHADEHGQKSKPSQKPTKVRHRSPPLSQFLPMNKPALPPTVRPSESTHSYVCKRVRMRT